MLCVATWAPAANGPGRCLSYFAVAPVAGGTGIAAGPRDAGQGGCSDYRDLMGFKGNCDEHITKNGAPGCEMLEVEHGFDCSGCLCPAKGDGSDNRDGRDGRDRESRDGRDNRGPREGEMCCRDMPPMPPMPPMEAMPLVPCPCKDEC